MTFFCTFFFCKKNTFLEFPGTSGQTHTDIRVRRMHPHPRVCIACCWGRGVSIKDDDGRERRERQSFRPIRSFGLWNLECGGSVLVASLRTQHTPVGSVSGAPRAWHNTAHPLPVGGDGVRGLRLTSSPPGRGRRRPDDAVDTS